MSSLEFSNVVLRIVEQHLKENVYTAIPARVISVENLASSQTVDIKPDIIDVYRDDRNVEFAPILDVPLIFPAGGGGLISFPIQSGDTVLAVFSERSIDEWIEGRQGDSSFTPKDKRSFSIADAIAIPGLYTKNTNLSPNPTDVELKFGDMSIRLAEDGNIYIDNQDSDVNINVTGDVNITATNIVAEASAQADVTAPQINLTGDVSISGDISIGGNAEITGDVEANEVTAGPPGSTVTLTTHTHTGGGSGPPTPNT